MNLSETEKKSILDLHEQGLSQNFISSELRISKPYVNAVIKASKGISGFVSLQNLPVNLPVTKPEIIHSNGSESYYLRKQIGDLEERLKDYKQDLASERMELEALRKKHLMLEVDFNSQEQRHKLELERKDHAIATNGKSALNGLIDPVLGPFTKNEKFMESFGIGLAKAIEAKLTGGSQSPSQAIPGSNHPQASDPQVQKCLNEIPQALCGFEKEKLMKLYDLVGLFLAPQFPGLIDKVHTQVTTHLQNPTT